MAITARVFQDTKLGKMNIWVATADATPLRLSPPAQREPDRQPTLDPRGTRRAPRVRIRHGLDLMIDGAPATVIDLSPLGAQVLSPSMLKPNQRVRVVLPTPSGSTRALGVVAWAAFERAKGRPGACYRAGLEFRDADPMAIADVCGAHADEDDPQTV
jgi:hypothetical protein